MNIQAEDIPKLQSLIIHLMAISSGHKTPREDLGLCPEIVHYMGEINLHNVLMPDIIAIMQKWEHFSGNYLFPVPAPINAKYKEELAKNHYWLASESKQMYEGEYGKLRRELAGFIAEEMSKWIKQRKNS